MTPKDWWGFGFLSGVAVMSTTGLVLGSIHRLVQETNWEGFGKSALGCYIGGLFSVVLWGSLLAYQVCDKRKFKP